MTREEMEELKGLAASMGLYDDKNPCKRAVILGKAIKALEQEPSYNSVDSLVESKLKNPKAKTFDILHFIADNAGLSTYEAIEKAYIMGASGKEPCEDAVSRQTAIDAIEKIHPVDTEYDCTLYDKIDVMYVLKDLPPVTPQQKTGHWIDKTRQSACGVIFYNVECSECGEPSGLSHTLTKYCPNCGAKMAESEDRGMYIACKKCKYNYDNECNFYDMGSGNEIDMPCYREKELIKEASDNFLQAFVGAESEG